MECRRRQLSAIAPLFDKYRFRAVRYSLYPMADVFAAGFGPGDLREALAARARQAARRPLVLAVQCDASELDAGEWLEGIRREATMLSALLDGDKPHALGMHGASATLATHARLGPLLEFLQESFRFSEMGRFAEIDAKHATREALAALARNGFRRLRLRCRDADDETALSRAFVEAAGLLGAAPDLSLGHDRVNEQALDAGSRCIVLNGERVAPLEARAGLIARAIDMLCAAGYENAGLDVFVSGALRNGSPFRSRFDVLGVGPAAITACADTYVQNEPGGQAYAAALRAHALPVARGLHMSADDVLRRDIIHSLECLGTVSFSSLEFKHGVVFDEYFAPELADLEEMQASGLVELYGDAIEVTPAGRPVARLVAAVFDRYLEPKAEGTHFASTNGAAIGR